MRPLHPALSALIGVVAGAGVVAAGLWLGGRSAGGDASPPAAPATAPVTATAADRPFWVAEGETVLGPTVLVPTGLAARPGELELAYDLVDIAPPPAGRPGPNAAESVAVPELWTLLTTEGPITGRTASIGARTARFAVPAGFDPSTVTGARIDAWRVRLPVTHDLDIPSRDMSWKELEPGTGIALSLVLPQTGNTLVQFDVDSPADAFSGASGTLSASFEARPNVAGRGPGWTNVGITDGGGVQLTYVGGLLPNPIPVRVRTHQWWTIEEPVNVDLGTVLDG